MVQQSLMQSPISKHHIQISKLGVLSLKIDAITERYNDLHNRLINDWRPKTIQEIKETKLQIETTITLLDQLYQTTLLDPRSSYIQILILKLKKSMNSQNEINIILENERENYNQQKGSGKNSQFQSQFQKEPLNLNQQKQLRNKINRVAEEEKLKTKPNKNTTPIKDQTKKVQKYSPFKGKQPAKVKVVVNNLVKKEEPSNRLRMHNRSRSPEDPSNYQSSLQKMGSARFNKPSNPRGDKLSNQEKLQNLMLTIKMTKEEYFQYMRDF